MFNYRQLAIACHFGSASRVDIDTYIESVVLSGKDYDSRIFEAHARDLKVAQAKILAFITVSFPEFEINSEDLLELCKSELKRQIGLLLDKKITPSSFCEFFNLMESKLVFDSEFASDELTFMGDLYNCCDWCDDTWTHDNSRHLTAEGIRVIAGIDNAEQGAAPNP